MVERINEKMIPFIEQALDIKLWDNQVNYLLKGSFLTYERRSGRTVAYCIDLALSQGEPLDMKRPWEFADGNHGRRYASSYFRKEFLRIRASLEHRGFPVRAIKV